MCYILREVPNNEVTLSVQDCPREGLVAKVVFNYLSFCPLVLLPELREVIGIRPPYVVVADLVQVLNVTRMKAKCMTGYYELLEYHMFSLERGFILRQFNYATRLSIDGWRATEAEHVRPASKP
jgi:hypothetical protein